MKPHEREGTGQVIDLRPDVNLQRYEPTDEQDREEWSGRILSAWQRSVEGILEAGRLLCEAKADLPHGEFEAMVRDRLPFGERTSQKLMAISRSALLANPSKWTLLPASWTTLYELSRLDAKELEIGLARRFVHPSTTGRDIPEAVRRARVALGRRALPKRVSVSRRPFLKVLEALLSKESRAALEQLEDRLRLDLAQLLARQIENAIAPPIDGDSDEVRGT